jgi:DNA-binding CsgD family transcriptional regulator
MPTSSAALTAIIDSIGRADFPAVTAQAVGRFMAFDLSAVIVHRPTGPSELLFDNFGPAGGRAGLETYAAVTHRLNPVLGGGRKLGAFRARDLAIRPGATADLAARYLVRAPDEELGFRTVGWPAGLEEVALYFRGWGGVVELSCYRPRGRRPTPRFGDFRAICAPVAAAFHRHAALAPGRADAPFAELSGRERQVVRLMLAGCGSEAIALRLGIGRHTVKDHRKRIFRELRVGSLAELFALQGRGALS